MLIPTKVETYSLLEDRPLAKLIAYTAGTSDQLPRNEKRKAVLIIPGGAYWMLGDAEADPVAHFFLSEGFNAFVLRYSVGRGVDSVWPKPLMEASAAMKFIRDHAEEFHIDPDYVFVIGFSAGGHLAGNLCVEFASVSQKMGRELDCKPTAAALCYPGKYAALPPGYGLYFRAVSAAGAGVLFRCAPSAGADRRVSDQRHGAVAAKYHGGAAERRSLHLPPEKCGAGAAAGGGIGRHH